MHTEEAYRWRKQAVLGLVLIAVGTVVLLDRMYYIDAGAYWRYWPLLLVVVGVTQTIGYPSPREFGSGLWMVFIGLWLFACFNHVFGLTFRNSWPLFILAWGVKLVFQPLVARRFAQQQSALKAVEHQHEG
ncbi:LiaF transmembrane domain-containing protein [Massilia varians]|uniref:LiaF transmembrane domain-containing protein n=1 Tax=Massilia varians TaxID=457921 RepID=UPI00255360CB|nr:DUF5668 domain-containing protein [Massilia varians]MDK6076820.1 DUF5668 domain-containing protein [Massilia varians]